MQVALHVTKLPNGATASNRFSGIGGISGWDDSQEYLSKAAVDRAWSSSSSPGYVGKANEQRAGWPGSKEAGAPPTLTNRKIRNSVCFSCLRHLVAAAAAIVVIFNLNTEGTGELMRRIHISAAVSVNFGATASLQVALHVTKLQNGATASNRFSGIGGISGWDDSQEYLSKAAVDRAFRSWFGGKRHQLYT